MNVTKWVPGQAWDASFTIGAEDTNTVAVNIQLKDFAGNDLAVPNAVIAYISTASTGLDVGTISGEIALTSSGDGAANTLLTHYAWLLISEADGDIDVTITDTGTTTQYLTLVLPNGKLVTSETLGFA